MGFKHRGMTLLEVLLAISVLAAGLFATAALQVRAMQASEGALRDGQAVRLAQTLVERVRSANTLGAADIEGWRLELRNVLGESAQGRAVGTGAQVSVQVRWLDPRAADWQVVSLPGEALP